MVVPLDRSQRGKGQMSYGFLSRKNWAGLDMGFVTVNSPPSTAGGLVTSSHVTGGVRLGVDCSVNPVALAGQERIMALPLGRGAKGAPKSHPLPRSAIVHQPPAAIVTPVNPVGTIVWPESFRPQTRRAGGGVKRRQTNLLRSSPERLN